MMVIAEPHIKDNWMDVAVHDKRKIKAIPSGHSCLWVVRPTGSTLLPLYSRLSDAKKLISLLGVEICPAQKYIALCQDHRAKFGHLYNAEESHYYIIIKRQVESESEIIELKFEEIVDIVTCGQFRWTDHGCELVEETP